MLLKIIVRIKCAVILFSSFFSLSPLILPRWPPTPILHMRSGVIVLALVWRAKTGGAEKMSEEVHQTREWIRARLFSTNLEAESGLLSNESTPQTRKDAYRLIPADSFIIIC